LFATRAGFITEPACNRINACIDSQAFLFSTVSVPNQTMSKDPFADALNADLNADLDDSSDSDAGLTMNGVAPSLDASDTHNVVSLDDLSVEDVHTAKLGVLSLPTAEAEESEAGTHTNNKVASATKKSASSSCQPSEASVQKCTNAALLPARLSR
jgi:hypothetical protein